MLHEGIAIKRNRIALMIFAILPGLMLNRTAALLSRMYNGTRPGLRTTREERFYKEFIQQMNVFQQAVLRYMEQGDNETEIKQMLDIKAENLGFKYSVLAETPALMLKFADCVRWNRA